MKYISQAPLRIGLAGGGTDVSPYCDLHTGAVLNATINRYANVILIPRDNKKVVFHNINSGLRIEFDASGHLEDYPELTLQIGVYNRICREFSDEPLSCEIINSIDVPSGSGLGSSSALTVALIGAFVEWLKLPLGEYDIAQLAVNIERVELNMIGGQQDQYASTFGGFNFMEFYDNKRVIVNPLRIKPTSLKEIEFHLLMFYTHTRRESSKIIETQKSNVENNATGVLDATHQLKDQAYKMKEAILKDNFSLIGELLQSGWENKKKLAAGISNEKIEDIYKAAIDAGALGGKISGAGGGGFIIFYCPGVLKYSLIETMKSKGLRQENYTFQTNGLETWTSHQ